VINLAQEPNKNYDDIPKEQLEDVPVPTKTKQEVYQEDAPTVEEISSIRSNGNVQPTREEPRRQQTQQKFSQQYSIPSMPSQIPGADPTQIQAVIESIIEEKWHSFVEDLGDYKTWKEKTELQLRAIKQEITRTQARIEGIEHSVLGKIKEYDSNITEFSTDIKALSKVFQKILEPLKENIKELSKITQDLKSK
jgi:hypothetical protein